jgi:collagenase-like PrtC family protease
MNKKTDNGLKEKTLLEKSIGNMTENDSDKNAVQGDFIDEAKYAGKIASPVENTKQKSIELLAPAGDFESLKAAIGNGADSVYFGASFFSARSKAKNFTAEELTDAIDYAHVHSCKAYLALNTLIMDHEIPMAVEIAAKAYQDGIDAIIVQDMGFAKLIKSLLPDLKLHASTQATIYDKYAVDACAELGFSRIILPRELEIADIAELTAYAGTKGIETEVFAHGALCVCYSGQCLMSSMIGGRSGNRGECAQPCRLTYDLMFKGRSKLRSSPLLATKDVSALDHIKELSDANVAALKIEGRMRSPEYVGVATRVFKKNIFAGDSLSEKQNDRQELLVAFNRGGDFTDNYLKGRKGPEMMTDSHVGSFGALLGVVSARNSKIGVVDIRKTEASNATQPLEKGDVIAIRRENEEKEIASAPIGSVEISGTIMRVKGFHPDVIEKLQINDMVYQMSDASLAREVTSADNKKTPVYGTLSVEGDLLTLEWTVTEGIAKGISYSEEIDIKEYIRNSSNEQVAKTFDKTNSSKSTIAGNEMENIASLQSDSDTKPENENFSGISLERCTSQLSKSGGTPFKVEELDIKFLPSAPVSILNQLRRESLQGLEIKIKQAFKRQISDEYFKYQDEEQTEHQNTKYIRMPQSGESVGSTSISNNGEDANFVEGFSNANIQVSNDYSDVCGLIAKHDMFSSFCETITGEGDSTNSKHSSTRRHEVSAFFYYWDGCANSIACKADWYELPIFAFFNEEAFEGLKILKTEEPTAKIAICMPPASTCERSKEFKVLLERLVKEGIDAILSGNPGNKFLCEELKIDNFQDISSNIFNSKTAQMYKDSGAKSIAASVELPVDSVSDIARTVFVDSSCLIELPAYGKLRLMYTEHCPVGNNRSGCQICVNNQTDYSIKDKKGISFPVVCHPQGCTVDILNGDILCAPAEVLKISELCKIRARIIFTDETLYQRVNMIEGFKEMLASGHDKKNHLQSIETIRQLAAEISKSQNRGLTKGHYQRGVN